MTAGSDPSGEPKTAPLHIAAPSDQHSHSGAPDDPSVVPPAIGSSASDACPTCGAQMALDQRYCLNCGNRRGDPRLPFMDAVTFMEASKQPPGGAAAAAAAPPPPPQRSGLSPGTTLIAGIATLILAVGVGVLIGRSGSDSSAPVASQKPTVIQVGGNSGGGGGEEAETATENNGAKKEASKGAAKSKGGGKKSAAPVEEGKNGGSKAAQEVLHTAPGVKEAAPEVEVGGKCEQGSAGCSDSGEFNGNFFGE